MYIPESSGSSQLPLVSRRRFVQGVAAASAVAAFGPNVFSAFGESAPRTPEVLSGQHFELNINHLPVNFTGRSALATAINGSVPGPTLRFREGETVSIDVNNHLKDSTSIHWHGLRIPAAMDGVPGLTYRGIDAGSTFHYKFKLAQSGTYWYHSHSRFQEQTGIIGSIIIDPARKEDVHYDREYVVLLSDWTDTDPEVLFSNLKQQNDYYNYGRQTVGDFLSAAKKNGLQKTVSNRLAWARMGMSPTDILDVTGATYTYLINGNTPNGNWAGLFTPGERIRLRFINASSMTIFDVRIPGLKMKVIQSDGNDVQPVDVDEFRMGVAETYDVIVEPSGDQAYTIFAQSMDRSGFARGTLTPKAGMVAAVPPMDPRPKRGMQDMGMGDMKGMDMSGGKGGMKGMDMSSGKDDMKGMDMSSGKDDMKGMDMSSGKGDMKGMDMSSDKGDMKGMDMSSDNGDMKGMDMSSDKGDMKGMDMSSDMRDMKMGSADGKTPFPQPGPNVMPMGSHDSVNLQKATPVKLHVGPQVDEVPMSVSSRLDDPGDGLNDNGRRVLKYTDLRAKYRGVDKRLPTREIELQLSGNMERYIWGINGRKFSEAEPIQMKLGERLRVILINGTMMEHPMHLHGLWSELENGHGEFNPYKHTILVQPAERVSFLLSADTPGNWAFHCHMLYHMEAGMMRTVVVS